MEIRNTESRMKKTMSNRIRNGEKKKGKCTKQGGQIAPE